jgi:hypothetical protein
MWMYSDKGRRKGETAAILRKITNKTKVIFFERRRILAMEHQFEKLTEEATIAEN